MFFIYLFSHNIYLPSCMMLILNAICIHCKFCILKQMKFKIWQFRSDAINRQRGVMWLQLRSYISVISCKPTLRWFYFNLHVSQWSTVPETHIGNKQWTVNSIKQIIVRGSLQPHSKQVSHLKYQHLYVQRVLMFGYVQLCVFIRDSGLVPAV